MFLLFTLQKTIRLALLGRNYEGIKGKLIVVWNSLVINFSLIKFLSKGDRDGKII